VSARADQLAAEMEAASAATVAGWRDEREYEPPTQRPADAELFRMLLEEGGRVTASVRSRASGEHVTVTLAAKRKGDDGRYVSRAKIEGRVGIRDAHAVFADDPDRDWPDNKLGAFYVGDGEWRAADGAERNRAWAAFALLRWALGGLALEEMAEVFIETTCCVCGKRLTDPESVERGIGPECNRRRTRSKAAGRHPLLEGEG